MIAMTWNGSVLCDRVKTELYHFFSDVIPQAAKMNNNEYVALLKKKYNHSGKSGVGEHIYINCNKDGVGIYFYKEINELDGSNSLLVPWGMAARHIRAWEYEKAYLGTNRIEEDTMARKLQLDAGITKDMKSAASDSFMDNIKMIDIDEIKPCKDNFYEISDIELLADDIEREGLKHNLVVTRDSGNNGYWVKSGHRRLEAIKLLINDKRRSSTKIPCYVDGEKTQGETQLDLIMLNATQRKYSDADMLNEYEQLEQTLKTMENEGKELKGRMRVNIAKILKVSPAQIGKVENIKHNAISEVEDAVKSGKMSISTANEVAKLSDDEQREIIEKRPTITNKEVKELQGKKAPAPPSKEKRDTYSTIDDLDEDDTDLKEDRYSTDGDLDDNDTDPEPEDKRDTYSTGSSSADTPKISNIAKSEKKEPMGTLTKELVLSFDEAETLLEFIDDNIVYADDEDSLAEIQSKLKAFVNK